MRRLLTCVPLLFIPLSTAAQEPKPNTLTPQEIKDGWLLLFDGATTFGWNIEGEAKADTALLILGGAKDTTATSTTRFGHGALQFEALTNDAKDARLTFNDYKDGAFSHVARPPEKGWHHFHAQVEPPDISIWADGSKGFGVRGNFASPTAIAFHVPAGQKLVLRSISFRPRRLTSLFNGKDLTGWREFPGRKSKFTVTEKGELNVKDGPGDLQTEGQWANFVLQLDCISHGPHLNSGIFFRCIPGQYQQGYEAQIRNEWKDNDRTKPVDFGTGAIYRRQPARKVVSSDNEWFTMTLVAHGNHLATWVNGYPVADWTDLRPPHRNPREGSCTEKGAISIQGHDPMTNLSFRNIRIGELP